MLQTHDILFRWFFANEKHLRNIQQKKKKLGLVAEVGESKISSALKPKKGNNFTVKFKSELIIRN